MTKSLENVETLFRKAMEETVPIDPVEGSRIQEPRTIKQIPRRRVSGYSHGVTEQAPWPPVGVSGPGLQAPRPLPKRPKGRFFIGGLLATLCLTAGWFVWTSFLNVAAYGLVTGDTLPLRAPWNGRVAQIHVLEGQVVHKNELIVTVNSADLLRKLDRLNDELRVEQGKLEADSVRIRQDAQSQSAEYFELWATLQKNREEHLRMRHELNRIQQLKDPKIISGTEHDRIVFAESGQRELVEKLSSAVDELRNRSERDAEVQAAVSQLKPTEARIAFLEGELRRTREELQEGELRSPVNGVVVRRHASVGQVVAEMDTVVEVVDQSSLQIELFIQQNDVEKFKVGSEVTVSIEPASEAVECTVIATRKQFEDAPESIQRYYRSREPLMPLILTPRDNTSSSRLQSGSVVRLKLLETVEWPSLFKF